MTNKTKYNWKNHVNRSVFDIVLEDGVIKTNDIYYIVEQVCLLPEINNEDDLSNVSKYVHPKNVIVNITGTVYLEKENVPMSLREAYIPPEHDVTYSSIIYSLGMMMLYMATGNVKKSDLDIFVEDDNLKTLIGHCIAFDPKDRYKKVDELLNDIKRVKRGFRKTGKLFSKVFIVLLLVTIGFYFYKNGESLGEVKGMETGYEKGYVYGYEKGFIDAPGIGISGSSFNPVNGNLFGNMNLEKGAITAFSNDEVFFVYESNIFQMNQYTEETKNIISDIDAYGLNYYDGDLYYSTDENIYKFSLKTMKSEVFLESKNGILYIVDDEFYLNDIFNTGYLYRINKDNKELTQLNGMNKYISLNIVDDKLFYIDAEKNNSIYSCDFDGSNQKLINSNSFESFSIYNDKIYAYAINFKEDAIDYSMSFLINMDLDGGNIEGFTNIPAYNINVNDGGIYYISGKNKVLKWMSLDGKTQYTISSFPTKEFNIAKRWIFYINEEDNSLWKVSIDGSKNSRISY